MTKRERVLAAAARRPVDRPPVAFWRHAPDVDHTAQGLADAMLAFHRRWDLDLIKVDHLFDLGRSTMDPAARPKAYSELARTMMEDATWVFLVQQVDIYATRDRLSWTPRADQWLLFHTATLK